MGIKLSVQERVALFNQCRILELLDEDAGDFYGQMKEALESGYEAEYERLFDRFSDGLSEDQCRFVRDVYGMYEALQRGYDQLKDKSAVDAASVTYRGYDGNNETSHMGYSRYLREERGLWSHVRIADHNSHMPSVGMYSQMLERYNEVDSHEPSAEQIKKIVGR